MDVLENPSGLSLFFDKLRMVGKAALPRFAQALRQPQGERFKVFDAASTSYFHSQS
jgi:hypothetical protein